MRVGFIGLGNMGMGMATNLVSKGSDLTVQTRTRSKVDDLVSKGANAADTPADLAANVDIVMCCLASVQLSRDILLGSNGVIENASRRQIIIDHGTVDMALSKECGAAARARGASFLDAPISGGPLGAANGTLAIMVGGEKEAFDRAKPELERMGTNVRLMGPSSAGTAMKLINQLLAAINSAAAAEAFQLANAANVDITEAAAMLAAGWGGSTMAARSAPITAGRSFANSGAPIRNFVKDIGIVTKLGQELGLAMPLSSETQALISATNDIDPDYDIAGIIEVLEAEARA